MKKSCLFLGLLMCIVLIPFFCDAQYIAKYKKDGDRSFENGAYYAAAVYYQKALKLLPDADYYLPYNVIVKNEKLQKEDVDKYQYLVYQLGESFRLYKDYSRAERWYEKAIKLNNDRFPLARLWYGVSLRADGRYKEALEALKSFQGAFTGKQKYIDRAKLEIASCHFAMEQMKYPRLANIEKLPKPVNVEKGSDYAPMRIGDTLYFSSSRRVKGIKPKKHSPYLNRIYKTTLNKKGFGKIETVSLEKNKYSEEATSSLNSTQQQLYFTEWHSEKGEKGQYVIVKSERDNNGDWTTGKVLADPVNKEGYNTKEAVVTADGKYLVFASDRPGGSGGYDLWYCSLNDEGQPIGDAVNLGDIINTEKDELNPYYDAEKKTLVFSSNGRIGMGGFDLYKSKGSFKDNQWTAPEDLGYPMNSSKDDNYYYPQTNASQFYTSSDRNSVCCLDLYDIQLKKIRLIGHVYDEDSHKPIAQVQTSLKDSITGETKGKLTTPKDGFFHFPLINRRPLKMHFFNKLYGTKDIVITNADLKTADSVYERDIYLKIVAKPIVIKNIYYDFDKANLRSESIPALDTLLSLLKEHPEWKVEIGSHTDALGSDKYNQWLSQQRAESVVDFLVAHGITKDRLKAKGYGESRPIAPNKNPDGSDNPKGRQLNRRTEFTIMGTIHQNGKEKNELKSETGDPEDIKVDPSRKYHLSRSEQWWRYKE